MIQTNCLRMTLCLLALVIAGPTSQGKPDFSGSWVLEGSGSRPPDVPRRLLVHQSKTSAPPFEELTVDREFPGDVRSSTYQIGLEGGVVGGADKDGRGSPHSRYSVRWDMGNRLVIENANYAGRTRDSGPYTEHAEVWWLDASGKLVMLVEQRSSEFGETTRTLTYRREK